MAIPPIGSSGGIPPWLTEAFEEILREGGPLSYWIKKFLEYAAAQKWDQAKNVLMTIIQVLRTRPDLVAKSVAALRGLYAYLVQLGVEAEGATWAATMAETLAAAGEAAGAILTGPAGWLIILLGASALLFLTSDAAYAVGCKIPRNPAFNPVARYNRDALTIMGATKSKTGIPGLP
jgi:hypothetical protein